MRFVFMKKTQGISINHYQIILSNKRNRTFFKNEVMTVIGNLTRLHYELGEIEQNGYKFCFVRILQRKQICYVRSRSEEAGTIWN